MSGVKLTVISLGAGVQSTTLALMAAKGEIGPMPDCAIFADTGWEPRAVYQHLDWLETVLPFPVHRVSRGNLRDKVIMDGYRDVPFYTPDMDVPGLVTMGRRQCTYQFKLRPLQMKVREMLGGFIRRGRCEMWIGISTDEAARMKPSKVKYIQSRWPLIERRMTRGDCLEWMKRNSYPQPPRSACLGCSFKSNREWRDTKNGPQDEWLETVSIDHALRQRGKHDYMHRSCKPLDQVDFSTAEDRGQLNMFNNECEGMCGL